MKCNCSLNNNYEVIGLCDIKKFNEKISQFTDKSWVQLNIPETLYLPESKPDIKSVTRVNINIDIISSKAINTPHSSIPNIEGLKLTGKILLVSGIICQDVVYIANNIIQSIHLVRFSIPFDTYIVIDADTQIEEDKFCVYPCIENVFIKPLDKRTFTKNINLFLFAHKILPESFVLNNYFVLNNHDNTHNVLQIGFDNCNKKIIAKSFGTVYDNSPGATGLAFRFILFAPPGDQDPKKDVFINKNENADDLAKQLNDFEYEIGDLIIVNFENNQNLTLTNYPNIKEIYTMLDRNTQSFEITKFGIVEYVLPNITTLYDTFNLPVLEIKYDILARHILINSTGRKTNPNFAMQQYFKITLLEDDTIPPQNSFQPNAITVKNQASIQGDEDGTGIKAPFFGQDFDFSDVMKLEYKEANRVTISNYPTMGNIYTPSGTEESFIMTKSGAVSTKLSNKISIKNATNQLVATIEFDKVTKKFIVESTGTIVSGPPGSYLELILKDNFMNNKLIAGIDTNQSADVFKAAVNNRSFEYENDRLALVYQNKDNIEITNYNGQPVYTPNLNADIFKITNAGLENASIDNKIKILNYNNEEMALIQLSTAAFTRSFIVATTTNPSAISTQNLERTENYMQFIILQASSSANGYSINGKENADNFIQQANNKLIEQGLTVLGILSRFNNKAIITNYKGQMEYTVNEIETFNFVNNMLQLRPLQVINIIKLKNNDDSYVVYIHIDMRSSRFIVQLIGLNKNTDTRTFTFKLKDSNDTGIKQQAEININEPGDDFKSTLDFTRFVTNDIIELEYDDGDLVEITNFQGRTYNPSGNSEKFRITNAGLVKYVPILPNTITIMDDNNQKIATIQFNKVTNKFIVESTGAIVSSSSSGTYFELILKDNDMNDKLLASINNNQSADAFKATVNNNDFEYDYDRLALIYKNKDKIEITDYNGQSVYTPILNADIFKITNQGLENASIDSKIKILNDNNEEMALIQLSTVPGLKSFTVVTTTNPNAISTQNLENNENYMQFTIFIGGSSAKEYSINGKENADIFSQQANNKSVNTGLYVLALLGRVRTRAIITNYNKQTAYIVDRLETFTLLNDVLQPKALNVINIIKLKNIDNSYVLYIHIDVSRIRFLVQLIDLNKNVDTNQFKVTIKDSAGTITQQATINKGEKGDSFKNDLDFTLFRTNYTIKLEYSNPSLVEITNFPAQGQTYNPSGISEEYRNTNAGLVKIDNKLPNAITIKDDNNQKIATIEFDKLTNQFIVESTGTVVSGSPGVYLSLILKDDNMGDKLLATINANENADTFKATVNSKSFEYDKDRLALVYQNKDNIEITNYNGQSVYTPLLDADIFKINNTGLENASINNKIKFLDDNNQEMALVQISTTSNTKTFMVATNTNPNAISSNRLQNNEIYMQFLMLQGTSGFINRLIKGKETSANFIQIPKQTIVDAGLSVFGILSRFNNTAIITNYNNQMEYQIVGMETFNFINNELKPKSLDVKNIIKLKNIDGSYVLYIHIDMRSSRFIVQLIDLNKNVDTNMFRFTLLENGTIKNQATINRNQKGDVFKDQLDFIPPFRVDYTIKLEYSNPSLVEITDFPAQGQTYNPSGVSEEYTITNNGLVKA